jgi:putative hydrolase of the HAD superfamily
VRDGGPWTAARSPSTLVLDCDGVVRHWDVETFLAAESELGLPPGSVGAVALEDDLLRRASTGGLTASAWAEEIGRLVATEHDVDPTAVSQLWADAPWSIDEEIVDLVRTVRERGVATACFSNATDLLEEDLAAAGVDDAFGTIVNSSRLGMVKPEAAFYAAACEAAGVEAAEVLFVDDRRDNVLGALEAGLHGIVFRGTARLRAVLSRVGLLA